MSKKRVSEMLMDIAGEQIDKAKQLQAQGAYAAPLYTTGGYSGAVIVLAGPDTQALWEQFRKFTQGLEDAGEAVVIKGARAH